jgi:hypothetical protein
LSRPGQEGFVMGHLIRPFTNVPLQDAIARLTAAHDFLAGAVVNCDSGPASQHSINWGILRKREGICLMGSDRPGRYW